MVITPSIMFGHVMHKRLLPKVNSFCYAIYDLALPLSQTNNLPIACDRFGLLSFYHCDHGRRDGSNIKAWVYEVIKQQGRKITEGEVVLLTFPRILGYVFNPVSFYICYDNNQNIHTVLCEVNNTFGQTHTYLCMMHSDNRPITPNDCLKAEKLFHVSPFLPRTGYYTFQFDISSYQCKININYYNLQNQKQLLTSLKGCFMPMTDTTLRKAFWQYPLVTFKAIGLIHWQALKLLMKGVAYNRCPQQHKDAVSVAKQK